MKKHQHYMKQCLDLGEKALTRGDAPVGSIVVMNGKVIGRGVEAGKSTQDITKHAEIEAIKDALKVVNKEALSESTLYTTHEPCLMCSYVLRHYKIETLVFGIAVDYVGGFTSGLKVLLTTEVPEWDNQIRIIGGILAEECKVLAGRYQLMQKEDTNEKR
jgi:tRNA(adenine34) deaminase